MLNKNNRGKKWIKKKSKKIVSDILKFAGATVLIPAGLMFIVATFNTFVNEQHARFERDTERAIKRALQQTIGDSMNKDTTVYNSPNTIVQHGAQNSR